MDFAWDKGGKTTTGQGSGARGTAGCLAGLGREERRGERTGEDRRKELRSSQDRQDRQDKTGPEPTSRTSAKRRLAVMHGLTFAAFTASAKQEQVSR